MEDKNLIGKKVRGFKFDGKEHYLVGYPKRMDNFIGKIGVIESYNLYSKSYSVKFLNNSLCYPAELIHQHLADETPTHYDNSNGIFGITKDTVVQQVMNDLNERSLKGIDKYNNTLEREDLELSDWLQHAYEETLDKANYLKRAILKLNESNLN